MAIAGKSKSKKVTRNPIFYDEKYTGEEPRWDTEKALKMADDEFDHAMRKSLFYYNYYYSIKDTKKYLLDWMKTTGTFTKEHIRAADRVGDKWLPMTVCSLIMANRAGMPFKPNQIEYINAKLAKAIEMVEPEVAEVQSAKATASVITIQDRLAEKTNELIGEIEGHYDLMMQKQTTDLKPYDFFVANNVPQGQLGKYEQVFLDRKQELELAQSGTDEQLKEGYRHLSKADFKRHYSFIDNILASVDQYRKIKKATKKSRVKKAPNKQKLVSKIKYLKEDKGLKLVSVNPIEILDSTELWIYNIKTRKLGKFVAEAYQTLSIKGTTIMNFDANKSVCKTLRKPEEKLKEFNKASKIQLRKFLEDIKATETRLKGRISPDIILLKTA